MQTDVMENLSPHSTLIKALSNCYHVLVFAWCLLRQVNAEPIKPQSCKASALITKTNSDITDKLGVEPPFLLEEVKIVLKSPI